MKDTSRYISHFKGCWVHQKKIKRNQVSYCNTPRPHFRTGC